MTWTETDGALLEKLEAQILPGDAPIEKRLLAEIVPGFSLAVLNNYEVTWTKTYGVRDNSAYGAERKHVDSETLFQAASISKTLTAFAVLRLVDQGVLDLDKDVHTYLKKWKFPAGSPTVTLRLLLSHRAGVNVSGYPGFARGNPDIPDIVTSLNGEGSTTTSKVVIDSVPGIAEKYSGGGYSVVQVVLEDVVGKPFDELMDELVLKPCGMHRSTFKLCTAEPPSDNTASGHMFGPASVGGGFLVYPEMAAAGLWTTPAELARFAMAIGQSVRQVLPSVVEAEAAEDVVKFDGPLLSPSAAKEFITIPGMAGEHTGDSKGMALGVNVAGRNERMRLSHAGGNHGFLSNMEINPFSGFGSVIMYNGHDESYSIRRQVISALGGIYKWPDTAESKDTSQNGGAKTEEMAKEVDWNLLSGTYKTDENREIIVSADSTCSFPPFAKGPFTLKRKRDNKFEIVGLTESSLEFEFEEAEKTGEDAAATKGSAAVSVAYASSQSGGEAWAAPSTVTAKRVKG
ncbi:beta-lactamase/transpeptidase-like protein [Fimicolochytrium jonesii]|uniref:beta-lactamase/transpeptidase-like protein n=1 Tax=Fimicolochytrium jonesii TaxID=1396493 RepID=UPI0022FE799F|nr:beta-lactamase/transpeptidase-like protein [Fimicolochytrium jonesii]KAI8825716.1 beta-lactamase/transpeptidase-like protein [Fimicolochytrium jonesii]